MTTRRLTPDQKSAIRSALELSWSAETSYCYNTSIAPASYGQCAPTAVVVFEAYGGEILRTMATTVDGRIIRHFYNRIAGERCDFTADQFSIPNYWGKLTYEDVPSSVEEACTEMLPSQLQAMRSAFARARSKAGE